MPVTAVCSCLASHISCCMNAFAVMQQLLPYSISMHVLTCCSIRYGRCCHQ